MEKNEIFNFFLVIVFMHLKLKYDRSVRNFLSTCIYYYSKHVWRCQFKFLVFLIVTRQSPLINDIV